MASQALQDVIELLRARPEPDVSTPAGVAAYREEFERLAEDYPLPAGLRRESVDAGGVPAEWFVPEGTADRPALLFLHGGAYVRGSPRTHKALIGGIAEAAGLRVLAPDYRLGPEHPHPAALEDALAAWRWLLARGEAPDRPGIAGDSAGGGLTLATLVALREAGDPLPAAAVCLSPWTDLALTAPSIAARAAADPFLNRRYLETMAHCYLGRTDPRAPLASPLYADLHGLPPLLIQVGTAEILLDDAVRVAERARAAGVDVTLEQWPDMIHVWHLFAHLLPEGGEGIARVGEWLRGRLG